MEDNKLNMCGICFKRFSYNYSLRKHLREKHPSEAPPVKGRKGILCSLCNMKLDSSEYYMEHLSVTHNIALEKEKLKFSSIEEFYEWKKGEETDHKYIQTRGGRVQLNGLSVTVYECHRSGMYVSRGRGIRNLKNQGSKKINGLCPAKIKASVSDKGSVSVEFIKTHVGHGAGEQHIHLSSQERLKIAEMIKEKIPFDTIIEILKNRPDASKRLRAVTKKDLHNVVCSYNLKEFVPALPKREKKERVNPPQHFGENSEHDSESAPVEICYDNFGVNANILTLPGNQNVLTDNIFILGLTETNNYVDQSNIKREKDRIKNIFLEMLDSMNSKEQLEALESALSPFVSNSQNHLSTINTADVPFCNHFFYDRAATLKLYPIYTD